MRPSSSGSSASELPVSQCEQFAEKRVHGQLLFQCVECEFRLSGWREAASRVIGVEGLRVADSSIFPRITNGNLNAPSIMVGEKISDHVLGRAPLAPDNAEPWMHPDWKTAQR